MSRLPGGAHSAAARGPPLAVKTNLGSSERPYIVDENGHIVAGLDLDPGPGRKKSSSGHILQIHGGTPSIIPRTPPRRAARSPPRTASRAARDVANDRPYGLGVAVRAAAPSSQIPSRAATRVKPRDPLRRGMGGQAFRVHRVPALSDNDLYLTQMRPPAKSSPLPHHKCNICHGMKSHPVSYRCGHGHCFVCIRRWLESSWECPTCRTVMTEPPMPNYDYEASIAHDHPEWRDTSTVNYSWKGLWFPAKPFVPPSPY